MEPIYDYNEYSYQEVEERVVELLNGYSFDGSINREVEDEINILVDEVLLPENGVNNPIDEKTHELIGEYLSRPVVMGRDVMFTEEEIEDGLFVSSAYYPSEFPSVKGRLDMLFYKA